MLTKKKNQGAKEDQNDFISVDMRTEERGREREEREKYCGA